MSDGFIDCRELKHKIRKLKQLEIKIRFGQSEFYEKVSKSQGKYRLNLIWDEFFGLQEADKKSVKYPLNKLTQMSRDEYKNVVSEFLFRVYYQLFMEKGELRFNYYDPDLLSQLRLPFDADINMIKKRFHELAKIYHPDAGGDSEKFMRLMKQYDNLVNR